MKKMGKVILNPIKKFYKKYIELKPIGTDGDWGTEDLAAYLWKMWVSPVFVEMDKLEQNGNITTFSGATSHIKVEPIKEDGNKYKAKGNSALYTAVWRECRSIIGEAYFPKNSIDTLYFTVKNETIHYIPRLNPILLPHRPKIPQKHYFEEQPIEILDF
jgi:hypothetical protein